MNDLRQMADMGQSGGRSLVERLQSAKDHMETAREDLADVDVPEAKPTVLKLDGLIDDMNERLTVLGK